MREQRRTSEAFVGLINDAKSGAKANLSGAVSCDAMTLNSSASFSSPVSPGNRAFSSIDSGIAAGPAGSTTGGGGREIDLKRRPYCVRESVVHSTVAPAGFKISGCSYLDSSVSTRLLES